MSDKCKDLICRACWTFLEAFAVTAVPMLTLEQFGTLESAKAALIAAAMAGCAAGLSALKTWFVNYVLPTIKPLEAGNVEVFDGKEE